MEDDAPDHGVGSRVGVAVDLVGFGGGQTAADGLDDERDDVAGAEDPEVEVRGKDGGVAAEDFDEVAQEDVDSCGEERWCFMGQYMTLDLCTSPPRVPRTLTYQ